MHFFDSAGGASFAYGGPNHSTNAVPKKVPNRQEMGSFSMFPTVDMIPSAPLGRTKNRGKEKRGKHNL